MQGCSADYELAGKESQVETMAGDSSKRINLRNLVHRDHAAFAQNFDSGA
jgi:hypothetical protein